MKLEDIISKKTKYKIMKIVWPIVEAIYRLVKDDKPSKITRKDWNYLIQNVKRGDVLLSTKVRSPSNLILPGKTKHAVMVFEVAEDQVTLIEAINPVVHKLSLFDFIKGKSILMHCRPKFISSEGASRAAAEAEKMIGKKYDHVWSPDNNWVYCSEVVYDSYKTVWDGGIGLGKAFPLTMKIRCGELTFIPDDIRLDQKNWDILWSNI